MVYIYNAYYLAMRNKETLPSVATWMTLRTLCLNKSNGEREMPYELTSM